MATEDPAKDAPSDEKKALPPIPPERRVNIDCSGCGWNAWVSVPLKVRALYFDSENKTGEIRSTPFELIACAGCGNRLFLNRGDDGKLEPAFDFPRDPLYHNACSGIGGPL